MTAAVQLERQTLHLMDGARRVLMIETKTVDTINGDSAPLNTPRRRYQLDNHLGSSSLELNDTAQAISYEEYHPYGSTAFHSANGAIAQKRYRYTGKEKDDETGLYYHGARYYAPWLGRWTAADPAGMVDGPNLYAYVLDNPMALRDEEGTQASGYDDWTIQNQIAFENALDQGTPIDQAGLPADVEGDLGLAASNPVVLTEDVITSNAANDPGPAQRARNAGKPELRSTEKSQPEEPERAQVEKDNGTVGEPGFAESLIPIWGSGRSAVANFQKGNVGLGLFYSALAVSDVFLVKSLVTVGGKLIVKGAATLVAKEGVALTEKVAVKEVGSIAARESATVAAKETAKIAGESAAKGMVALDTNVIIAALKEGKTAAVDAAIAGRVPIVPIAAAREFIKANGRAGANALREFLAARGGRLAAVGAEATAEGLRNLATSLGRSLRLIDSRVAAAAMREGVPLITNDKKFFNFLQAIGYAVRKY